MFNDSSNNISEITQIWKVWVRLFGLLRRGLKVFGPRSETKGSLPIFLIIGHLDQIGMDNLLKASQTLSSTALLLRTYWSKKFAARLSGLSAIEDTLSRLK